MVALRRKKGDIFVALVSFMFVAVSLFLLLFTQSIFAEENSITNVPLMNLLIINPDVSFLTGTCKFDFNFFKNFESINYPFAIAFAAPLVFSFLSIFFKRFRFMNVLTFVSIVVVLFILFFGGVNVDIKALGVTENLSVNFREPLKSFSMPFMIGRFTFIGAAFFSLINLEICR